MAQGNGDPCLAKVLEAAAAEQRAIEHDRKNETEAALAKYGLAERSLEEAVRVAEAEGKHADDRPRLERHRQELLDRMVHLRCLTPGQAPTIPLEQQVRTVELSMTHPSRAAGAGAGASPPPQGTFAGAVVLGAFGGAAVLGGTLAMPLAGAVAGAAALGYAATRNDDVGTAVRTAGGSAATAATTAADKAKEISTTAADKAKEIDERYQIRNTVASKSQEFGSAVASRAPETTAKAQELGNNAKAKAQELGATLMTKAPEFATTVQSKAQEICATVKTKAEEIQAGADDVVERGRVSRGPGSTSDFTNKLGDFARGLVSEGKETRGGTTDAPYSFGDLSRGVVKKLGFIRAMQSEVAASSGSAAPAAAPTAASAAAAAAASPVSEGPVFAGRACSTDPQAAASSSAASA